MYPNVNSDVRTKNTCIFEGFCYCNCPHISCTFCPRRKKQTNKRPTTKRGHKAVVKFWKNCNCDRQRHVACGMWHVASNTYNLMPVRIAMMNIIISIKKDVENARNFRSSSANFVYRLFVHKINKKIILKRGGKVMGNNAWRSARMFTKVQLNQPLSSRLPLQPIYVATSCAAFWVWLIFVVLITYTILIFAQNISAFVHALFVCYCPLATWHPETPLTPFSTPTPSALTPNSPCFVVCT